MGNRAPKKPPKAAAPKRAASKATPAAVDAETRHPQASATYRDEVGAMLADPARFDEGVEYLYRLAVESDVGKPGQIGQATFAQPGLSALSMLPEAERMRYLDAVLGMMPDRLPASVIARLPLADKLRGLPEGVRHGFAPELQVDRAPGPTPDMEGQLLPRPPARMSKKQREAELRRVAAEGRQAAGLVEVAVGPATRAKPPPASAKYGVPYLIEDDTARRAARAAFPVQPGAEIVVVSAPEGGLPSGWDERDARRGWKSITYHGVKGDDTSAPRSVMQVLDSRADEFTVPAADGKRVPRPVAPTLVTPEKPRITAMPSYRRPFTPSGADNEFISTGMGDVFRPTSGGLAGDLAGADLVTSPTQLNRAVQPATWGVSATALGDRFNQGTMRSPLSSLLYPQLDDLYDHPGIISQQNMFLMDPNNPAAQQMLSELQRLGISGSRSSRLVDDMVAQAGRRGWGIGVAQGQVSPATIDFLSRLPRSARLAEPLTRIPFDLSYGGKNPDMHWEAMPQESRVGERSAADAIAEYVNSGQPIDMDRAVAGLHRATIYGPDGQPLGVPTGELLAPWFGAQLMPHGGVSRSVLRDLVRRFDEAAQESLMRPPADKYADTVSSTVAGNLSTAAVGGRPYTAGMAYAPSQNNASFVRQLLAARDEVPTLLEKQRRSFLFGELTPDEKRQLAQGALARGLFRDRPSGAYDVPPPAGPRASVPAAEQPMVLSDLLSTSGAPPRRGKKITAADLIRSDDADMPPPADRMDAPVEAEPPMSQEEFERFFQQMGEDDFTYTSPPTNMSPRLGMSALAGLIA